MGKTNRLLFRRYHLVESKVLKEACRLSWKTMTVSSCCVQLKYKMIMANLPICLKNHTLVVITMNRKWEYASNYNFPPPTMHGTDQIIQMEMYISRVHTGHQWSLTVQLGTSFSTIAVRYTWLICCWIWGNFHWFDHWVDRIRASLSLLFNNVKSQP